MVHRRRFFKIYSIKFCDIWQNFYFYRIENNDNFKMEVKQTNFVTHLIITVLLYFSYLKTRLLKFGQIRGCLHEKTRTGASFIPT